ncbi:MAG: hypothetical protein NTW86_20280 [Candidatus Sumerlaeota bacterium]|nr:hypothetical protein [Candidatus Sumerlaeota bacterium]
MTRETEQIAADLLQQIREHKYAKLDELWVKLLDDPPTQPAFYQELGQRLTTTPKREQQLVEMVALAVMQWTDQGRHADALKVIQIILPHTKNPKDLHEPLVACLRAVYGGRPSFERFLKASGLLYDTEIKKNYLKLRMWLLCDEGRVFRHATRGVGVVTAIDEVEGFVELAFEDERPTRFSFAGVRQFLEAVPDRHVLARKVHDPEGLMEQARKDPAAFLKWVVKDMGGQIRQSELKTLLTTRFFKPSQWTAWWNKNRYVFRLDPYIEFRGAANPTIALRKEPRSFHEECAEAFERAEAWADRNQAAQALAKVQSAQAMPEAVARRLAAAYGVAVRAIAPANYAQRLDAAYTGQALRELLGESEGVALDRRWTTWRRRPRIGTRSFRRCWWRRRCGWRRRCSSSCTIAARGWRPWKRSSRCSPSRRSTRRCSSGRAGRRWNRSGPTRASRCRGNTC